MEAILVPRHFVNDRSTSVTALSVGEIFGRLQMEECQLEKELSSGLNELKYASSLMMCGNQR